jgi:hypothetical protein
MADVYEQRFGVPGEVILPTHKGGEAHGVSPRVATAGSSLSFGYGGSINSAEEMDQIVGFAQRAHARGHRLIAFTPQHQLLSERAAAAGVPLAAHAPVHSDVLMETFRRDVDCLLLPQSMADNARPYVSTAFPTKWADYSTLGVPVLVFAPPESSSARFVQDHPGCAALVTSNDPAELDQALTRLEGSADYRRSLAETLLRAGRTEFSPDAAWQRFATALAGSPMVRA